MRARLRAIADLTKRGGTLIDVGCDHGLLPYYILSNNLAQFVIASDVSQMSLSKARQLLAGFDNVDFRQGDGLSVVGKNESIDTIVISGMGGREIAKILQNGKNVLQKKPQLLLSPQRDARLLREYLLSINFAIKKDFCIKEKGIFYDIIEASWGECLLSDTELEWGVSNLREPNEAFWERLENELAKIGQKTNQKNASKMNEKSKKILDILTWLKTKN